MKKLMIAVAAVALSVGANAAALSWSSWGYTGADPATGDWFTGGQAYLVMITDAGTFSVANNLSVTGGTIVQSAAFDGGTVAGLWNDTTALVNGTTYLFAIIGTTAGTGITVPTTGTYGVDNNGGNSTASGYYEVTWSASTGGSLDANGAFAGFAMNTAVGGAVPEPTSGLLLLLGMAGLALKRKIA